jgi:hypothetical protein
MSHFAREMETGAARTFGCIAVVFLLLVGGCVVKFVLDDMSARPRAYFPSLKPEDRDPPIPDEAIQRDPPLPEFLPKNDGPEPRKHQPNSRPPVVISPRDGKAAKIP